MLRGIDPPRRYWTQKLSDSVAKLQFPSAGVEMTEKDIGSRPILHSLLTVIMTPVSRCNPTRKLFTRFAVDESSIGSQTYHAVEAAETYTPTWA